MKRLVLACSLVLLLLMLAVSSAQAAGNGFSPACELAPDAVLSMDAGVTASGAVFTVANSPAGDVTVYRFKQGTCAVTVVAKPYTAPTHTPTPYGPVESAHPYIAVSKDGDVVVVYRVRTGYPYNVYAIRKPAHTATFSKPILIAQGAYPSGVALDSKGRAFISMYNAGGFVKVLNADNTLGQTYQITNQRDSEPKVGIDSHDNVAVVYSDYGTTPVSIAEVEITADGVKHAPFKIAKLAGSSLNPRVAVDNIDGLHVVFNSIAGGTHQIELAVCWNLTQCSTTYQITHTTTASLAADVATCQGEVNITYYNGDSGVRHLYLEVNEYTRINLGIGTFSSIVGGPGLLNVLFRDGSGKLAYRYRADTLCQ